MFSIDSDLEDCRAGPYVSRISPQAARSVSDILHGPMEHVAWLCRNAESSQLDLSLKSLVWSSIQILTRLRLRICKIGRH